MDSELPGNVAISVPVQYNRGDYRHAYESFRFRSSEWPTLVALVVLAASIWIWISGKGLLPYVALFGLCASIIYLGGLLAFVWRTEKAHKKLHIIAFTFDDGGVQCITGPRPCEVVLGRDRRGDRE